MVIHLFINQKFKSWICEVKNQSSNSRGGECFTTFTTFLRPFHSNIYELVVCMYVQCTWVAKEANLSRFKINCHLRITLNRYRPSNSRKTFPLFTFLCQNICKTLYNNFPISRAESISQWFLIYCFSKQYINAARQVNVHPFILQPENYELTTLPYV